MKPRRKGASEKIESRAARNVCFSKRRKGLFNKAQELCNRHPNVSVNAIAFSPAGKPFVFGDPSSVSSLYPSSGHQMNEINALLGLDISSFNREELESHGNDLLRLRSILLSKYVDGGDVPNGNEGSGFALGIEKENLQGLWVTDAHRDDVLSWNRGSESALGIEDENLQGLWDLDTHSDDVPGWKQESESLGIYDQNLQGSWTMDTHSDDVLSWNEGLGSPLEIGEEYGDLQDLKPGCTGFNDGARQDEESGFSLDHSFSIEDDEIGLMLRDFVADDDAHCDMDGMNFDAGW